MGVTWPRVCHSVFRGSYVAKGVVRKQVALTFFLYEREKLCSFHNLERQRSSIESCASM